MDSESLILIKSMNIYDFWGRMVLLNKLLYAKVTDMTKEDMHGDKRRNNWSSLEKISNPN